MPLARTHTPRAYITAASTRTPAAVTSARVAFGRTMATLPLRITNASETPYLLGSRVSGTGVAKQGCGGIAGTMPTTAAA